MTNLYAIFEPDAKQKPNQPFDINLTVSQAIKEFTEKHGSREIYEIQMHPETLETHLPNLNPNLPVKLTPGKFGSKTGVKFFVEKLNL